MSRIAATVTDVDDEDDEDDDDDDDDEDADDSIIKESVSPLFSPIFYHSLVHQGQDYLAQVSLFLPCSKISTFFS